jgi:hypothetical protein
MFKAYLHITTVVVILLLPTSSAMICPPRAIGFEYCDDEYAVVLWADPTQESQCGRGDVCKDKIALAVIVVSVNGDVHACDGSDQPCSNNTVGIIVAASLDGDVYVCNDYSDSIDILREN